MDWLNYHHLLYFWVAAREGSISKACEHLQLAQPTVSSQIQKLEKALGEKLFERVGRNLKLTETGQLVFRYADEIFSLGRELTDAIKGRPTGKPLQLTVGAPEVIPKLIVHRLLEPALKLDEPVQIVCREGKLDSLIQELATHNLDMVLSDSAVGSLTHVRAFNHALGECSVSIFGVADTAKAYRRRFPSSLEGAPMLLPSGSTWLRRAMDKWFDDRDIRPHVAAEFDDSALMKVFGQSGLGLFPGPSAIEHEICRQYNVRVIGRLDEVREQYFAISVERKLKHPAVVAISEAARQELFAEK
ncbi:MAG: transcriptional activator NhaR [Pirellulales bacterium]|nr:transcriptional activator NhaR [Pirellulales bacterium]